MQGTGADTLEATVDSTIMKFSFGPDAFVNELTDSISDDQCPVADHSLVGLRDGLIAYTPTDIDEDSAIPKNARSLTPKSSTAGPLYFSQHPYSTLCKLDDSQLFTAGKLLLPMMYNGFTDRFDAVEWGYCFHLISQMYKRCPVSGSVKADLGSQWRIGSSITFRLSDEAPPSPHRTEVLPLRNPGRIRNKGSNREPDLVIHLVSSLTRGSLIRGTTTLLLPCMDADGSRAVVDFLDRDGGWALPISVIAREITSRVG